MSDSDLFRRMVIALHDRTYATEDDLKLLCHALGCTMRKCFFNECKAAKPVVNHAVKCRSRTCVKCTPGRAFLEMCDRVADDLFHPFPDCDELVQPSDDARSLA